MILTVSRAQTASQSEPCLDNNHIIPTQEHRQREKYRNQYRTLTSVCPLKFLPTRHFPPQLKEDIQLEQPFKSYCWTMWAKSRQNWYISAFCIYSCKNLVVWGIIGFHVCAAHPVFKEWHIGLSGKQTLIISTYLTDKQKCIHSVWLAMAMSGGRSGPAHSSDTSPAIHLFLAPLSRLCTFHFDKCTRTRPLLQDRGRWGGEVWIEGNWIW